MISIVKAPSNILDHFSIFLSLSQIDWEPLLNFFNLLLLVLSFNIFVEICWLFDRVVEHLLLVLVHLPHILFRDLVVEHFISLVLPEKNIWFLFEFANSRDNSRTGMSHGARTYWGVQLVRSCSSRHFNKIKFTHRNYFFIFLSNIHILTSNQIF